MKDIKGRTTEPAENLEEVRLNPEAMRVIVEVCVNAVLRDYYAHKERQKEKQREKHASDNENE